MHITIGPRRRRILTGTIGAVILAVTRFTMKGSHGRSGDSALENIPDQLLRARVRAAFFAAADRVGDLRAVLRADDFLAAVFLEADFLVAVFFEVALLRVAVFLAPDPLAPPSCLFTVAQARFSAVFLDTPFFSYPSSMCSAWRFCLLEYEDLSPRGMTRLRCAGQLPAKCILETDGSIPDE